MPARAIEEDAGADDVGVNEILRGVDAAIDVGLGGEVDHRKKGVLGHERIHLVGIGNIGLEEFVALAVLLRHAVEIGEVARVGQNIHVADRRRVVMMQNVANKIAPDESTTTGHENAHGSAY